MSHPTVSIITGVYNGIDYIEEAFHSVITQTYTDWEWIIANDGSTDGTLPLLMKLHKANYAGASPKRIHLCHDNERLGLAVRRNYGIHEAKGKYIAIQDADDISLPTRLEKQVAFLDAHQDIFCVGAHAEMVDVSGKHISVMDYPPSTHEHILKRFCVPYVNPMIDPTACFRTDQALSIGAYMSSADTIPDLNLWYRAILNGYRFANISEILVKYRNNPKGVTQSRRQDMFSQHVQSYQHYIPHLHKRLKEENPI